MDTQLNILVVEDHDDLREATVAALSAMGCRRAFKIDQLVNFRRASTGLRRSIGQQSTAYLPLNLGGSRKADFLSGEYVLRSLSSNCSKC
jgi:CheY-like chemotaxis protein